MAGDTEVTATNSTPDAAVVDTSKADTSTRDNSLFDNLRIAPLAPRADLHPEYSDQAFQSGSVGSARVQGAKIGLSAPGPASSTNAAPQPFTGRPGSLGWQLAQVAPLLPSLAKRYGAGQALLMSSTTAIGGVSRGPEEEGPPTPPPVPTTAPEAVGSSGWGAAQSNADQTRPTTPVRQGPDRAQAASGMVDRLFAPLAGQAGALGGAGNAAKASMAISKEDQLATANANAQMLHEQILSHKMGEDGLQASVASGKAGLAAVQSGHIPGQVLAMDKTSDDINRMLKSGQFNLSSDTAFLTGRTPIGADSNGVPMYRSTYTVVRLSPAPVELSEDDAKYLNDNIPGQKLQGRVEDKDGKVTQKGQEITPAQLNWMWQQASNTERVNAQRDAELGTWKVKKEKAELDLEADKLASKPFMTDLLARNNATYSDKDGKQHYDPFNLIKAFYDGLADPAAKEQTGGKFSDLYKRWVGEKEFDILSTAYDKQQTKNATAVDKLTTDRSAAAKDPDAAIPAANALLRQIGPGRQQAQAVLANPKATADDKAKAQAVITSTQEDYNNAQETIATAKEAQNQKVEQAGLKTKAETEAKTSVEGNPNLTGDEYIASLPAGEQDLVKSIGTGHMALDRVGLLLARNPKLAAEISKAYPPDSPYAFDSSKAAAYPQMVRDYTSTKPNSTGGALNAGATALKHLKELKELNTVKSRVMGTDDYNAYHNKLDTVTGELAMFYQLPKDDTSMQAMKSTLGAFFNRDAAIETQAKSMGDKFDSLEQSWKNGIPSKLYNPPMPQVDAAAKAARASLDPNYAARLKQEKTKATAEVEEPVATSKVDLNVAPPPTPESHVFDSKAWAAANPGKDVNKAIMQAKKKGYEVR